MDKKEEPFEGSNLLSKKEFIKRFRPIRNNKSYGSSSPYLAKHANKHFNIWFDKFKYDYYGMGTCNLAVFCSGYIIYWYDPKFIDWSHKDTLRKYCDKYKNLIKQDLIIYSLLRG